MVRLKLYFGLILLHLLKIVLSTFTLFFLVLFAPILVFIRKRTFYYCIDEFYKNLK